VLDILYASGIILSLLISGLPYLSAWLFPTRSKLTVLIDYTEFDHVNAEPSFTFKVFGNVVNDSPKSASIIRFNVTLNYYKIRYEILSQSESYGSSLLLPSGQTRFTLSRVVVGENNTFLPQTSLRSVLVSVLYQDEEGLQEAIREYGYL